MAAAAPAPISREVFVQIFVDPKGNTRVEPDTFWVSKGAKQEVVWYCTSTDPSMSPPGFEVDFGNKSPFYQTQFGTRRSRDFVYSGLVREDVEASASTYKYTVRPLAKETKPPADPDGGVKP